MAESVKTPASVASSSVELPEAMSPNRMKTFASVAPAGLLQLLDAQKGHHGRSVFVGLLSFMFIVVASYAMALGVGADLSSATSIALIGGVLALIYTGHSYYSMGKVSEEKEKLEELIKKEGLFRHVWVSRRKYHEYREREI
jgi:hypothetical protein